MTCLRDLHMSHNEIIDIPNWIGELKDLKQLKASNNKVLLRAPSCMPGTGVASGPMLLTQSLVLQVHWY